jgi:hypothetical protein
LSRSRRSNSPLAVKETLRCASQTLTWTVWSLLAAAAVVVGAQDADWISDTGGVVEMLLAHRDSDRVR